ncbi:hypothetical protein O2N63_09315 [Aliiroseovarius sp. KMU-50]|uniref:DUF4239 domain-containing protein n=1 Tax=Aliiroseovarius salicola TaxID=3009082 RepID=A0ABT4W1A4_9RHOB|nr:hypothetical protein [Aliiroseovarius sp. KMU-50]MDA5094287.1 hypothetical protein [Aliiroseovarius sp. KMU-50]
MSFVTTYQLHLLLSLFLLGCIGTLFLFRKPPGHRAWLLADLVWVVLGGMGALVAIIAGLYTADSSRLDRQIDLAYAATSDFDQDAARFRLRYCDQGISPKVAVLCEKIEYLSASTATNAELPLFIEVTQEVAPLTGLSLLVSDHTQRARQDMKDMVAKADAFDIERFLVFASRDMETDAAVTALRPDEPAIAGDFQVLAQSYDTLIDQVGKLQEEWKYLQENAHILVLQILALCLVSFAAPFRLGKSMVELRSNLTSRS